MLSLPSCLARPHYRHRAILRHSYSPPVVRGNSSAALDLHGILRAVYRRFVPSLPIVPVFGAQGCKPFCAEQRWRASIAAALILSANDIVLDFFFVHFISLLPVQPVGQLLCFVGNGQFPVPFGMNLLYRIFAVPSSVFGIISEYI